MPGSGKVLSTLLFYRALTEQQSWQEIAQSKGMTYLQRLPELVPEGQFLVHNSARPTDPSGRKVSARGCVTRPSRAG